MFALFDHPYMKLSGKNSEHTSGAGVLANDRHSMATAAIKMATNTVTEDTKK